MPEPTSYKPDILRRALDNLLRRKAYHMAPPSRKNIMVLREYSRILKNKQLSHYTWKKELTKE